MLGNIEQVHWVNSKLWVLPASFVGGPRDMRRRDMDVFALE
jgi:hypothetical protein